MPLFLAFKTRTSTPTRRRPVRRRPPASRLCLESLEARCLLSFSPAALYSAGASPRSVAVGDFNGDGKLDLGVTSNVNIFLGGTYANYYATGESRANVLLGTGTGAFPTLSTTSLGSGQSHTSATVADFNGDHNQDF